MVLSRAINYQFSSSRRQKINICEQDLGIRNLSMAEVSSAASTIYTFEFSTSEFYGLFLIKYIILPGQ